MGVDNKGIIVLSGASSGIGLAISRILLLEGFSVIGIDKNFTNLEIEDENFKQFVSNIGLYLNKEIPLNDEFPPSWSAAWNNHAVLSITMQMTDCLIDKPLTKINIDGFNYSYTVAENIDLKEAKTLAPNINQDFISIKSIKTSGNTSATFGILDVEGKLIMVPLKILNTW